MSYLGALSLNFCGLANTIGFCWILCRVYAINIEYRNNNSQWQKNTISHLCRCIFEVTCN
jgi:hypothetical protein